ncbi:ribosomal-protein-alanine N-acetyltransferase [Zeimonas arvi]|uniref:[Ribosomal protein bS18]-alanine N-acetyltransferase n=2 Tax=Zeimonas arvi TaxID=2498847 RepID=A0A5C8P1J7_9BURK|nr:ribosomal-protein-alanine N-acetyltransferase [Zeimonas arvi]
MPGVRARHMARHDLPRVIAIENEIYSFPWSPGNFSDSLEAGYDCWAFDDGSGALVAYAVVMWIPDEVHLLNLSVAAPRQRRGLGRAILEWVSADAARRGARGMLLEVRPSNLPALRLYERSGFERIGVRRRYYPAPDQQREDAWVLFRRFGAQAGQGEQGGHDSPEVGGMR